MKLKLQQFIKDQSGAVTVDWVVLTAAIVGLGTFVIQAVGPGLTGLGASISTSVSGTSIGYTPPKEPDPE